MTTLCATRTLAALTRSLKMAGPRPEGKAGPLRSSSGNPLMRDVFPPPCVTFCLLGALLWGYPLVLAGQEVTGKGGTPGVASARAAAASVDPRFRSPRATVRT